MATAWHRAAAAAREQLIAQELAGRPLPEDSTEAMHQLYEAAAMVTQTLGRRTSRLRTWDSSADTSTAPTPQKQASPSAPPPQMMAQRPPARQMPPLPQQQRRHVTADEVALPAKAAAMRAMPPRGSDPGAAARRSMAGPAAGLPLGPLAKSMAGAGRMSMAGLPRAALGSRAGSMGGGGGEPPLMVRESMAGPRPGQPTEPGPLSRARQSSAAGLDSRRGSQGAAGPAAGAGPLRQSMAVGAVQASPLAAGLKSMRVSTWVAGAVLGLPQPLRLPVLHVAAGAAVHLGCAAASSSSAWIWARS
jgi:hypothetical protein